MSAEVFRKTRQRSAKDVSRVTFVLQSENRADVLPRVVLLFHRLNVEIAALYLVRRRGSETMRMSVTVAADQERAARMVAHLYKVVSVTSVKIECHTKELVDLTDKNEQRSHR
jgi:acetolactate synthase small subunit